MANNRDFFDEEFDKMNESKTQSETGSSFDNWCSHPTPHTEKAKSSKPWYIVLLCVGLVLCIVLGWVLATVFGGVASNEEQVLSKVFDVLHSDYYKNVPQEDMWKAVEAAGTALLQNGGDQFCRLMSPQTYYDYLNPQSDILVNDGDVFGITFQHIEGLGMYISSITANGPSYGLLKQADIVYRLSNVKDKKGAPLKLTIDNVETDLSEIIVGDWATESFQDILTYVNSATFHAIRNGYAIDGISLKRGTVSYVNSQYPYEFVEFYFGDDCTNISTKKINNLEEGVKTERRLAELAKLSNTGYVRISQFSETDTINGKTSADKEFQQVMALFRSRNLKRLILDLKGNPGGSVDIVCNIASYLVTDSKLDTKQQTAVNNRDGLLITTLTTRNSGSMTFSRNSNYNTFFNAPSDVCDIVVWTDGGSASASELLTGALRDYQTAVQMGTTTYGKGIAQTIKPLKYTGTVKTVDGGTAEEHWAIYYTIAQYFSPLGDNIDGDGYSPAPQYSNLDTYEKLWASTIKYWSNSGGGLLV